MIRCILFISLVMVLSSCVKRKDAQYRKSRTERVAELPYRTLSLSNQDRTKLFGIGELIWENFKNKNTEGSAVFSMNTNKQYREIFSNKDMQELRDESNNLWKKDELVWSAIIYESSSIHAQTNAEKLLFVIEIEYHEITGTFYLFIPIENQLLTMDNCTYVDRN